MEIGLEQSF